MIKFNGLNLKDLKITDSLASVVNGKKIAVGSEVIWEKSASPLPSGYTQVKYLQSSGTQYIDTLINASDDLNIRIKFSLTADALLNSINYVIGTYGNGGQSARTQFSYTSSSFCGWGARYTSTLLQPNTNEHIIEMNRNNFKLDNAVIYTVSDHNFAAAITMYLFGVHASGTGNVDVYTDGMKIHEAIISNSTDELMNLIPYLDRNNVPCFYDTVSQQTFYNAGTGEFGYETMDGTVVAPI